MVFSVFVCPPYSGHLSGVSLRGDPGQAALPPLCLHWQHQVYPPGMVRSVTKNRQAEFILSRLSAFYFHKCYH